MVSESHIGCGCNILTLILSTTFACFLLRNTKQLLDEINQPTDYLNQVVKDWETVPLIDLVVTKESSCPEGTELVLKRDWYGIQLSCDCLNIYSGWIYTFDTNYENKMNLGIYCDYNMTQSGCRTVKA